MSLQHAILGWLHRKPMSGYELKKMMQTCPFMPWSGNNNQIYKSLTALLDAGLVTREVQHQESLPAKKIYSISEQGVAELKRWVLSAPELPELHHPFLIRLASAAPLSPDEWIDLIDRYALELSGKIKMLEELQRRDPFVQGRNDRESMIWSMIYEHGADLYRHEAKWLLSLRSNLGRSTEEGGL